MTSALFFGLLDSVYFLNLVVPAFILIAGQSALSLFFAKARQRRLIYLTMKLVSLAFIVVVSIVRLSSNMSARGSIAVVGIWVALCLLSFLVLREAIWSEKGVLWRLMLAAEAGVSILITMLLGMALTGEWF